MSKNFINILLSYFRLAYLALIMIAISLEILEAKYGISKKLIELIKEEMKRKPKSPEGNLQHVFNRLGKIK
ncbi:hypothetical protein F0L16_10595 [Photorhabdus heterorhabditis]|uniref:Uncharacterized protein n=1 Tax=Photorhabdus heterorhabditis TaxID=880156 RepID=A0A5B0WRS5_9GAMM|nr:hypothetical protein F0L16_10595 [Photorhabdus heterorhabditis]KOY62380.1 hypothetical protein AM629_09010 [Photorhabdus heterorhabditis]